MMMLDYSTSSQAASTSARLHWPRPVYYAVSAANSPVEIVVNGVWEKFITSLGLTPEKRQWVKPAPSSHVISRMAAAGLLPPKKFAQHFAKLYFPPPQRPL